MQINGKKLKKITQNIRIWLSKNESLYNLSYKIIFVINFLFFYNFILFVKTEEGDDKKIGNMLHIWILTTSFSFY